MTIATTSIKSSNCTKTLIYFSFTLINISQFIWTDMLFKTPALIYLSFLTFHSLIHNTIFYSYMLAKSVLFPRRSFGWENIYFKFIFCVSLTVATIYWVNQLYNTYLIVPKERTIPFLLDFLTHGFNFIMNFFVYLTIHEQEEKGNKLNSIHLVGYFGIYAWYIKYGFRSFGFSPYPVVSLSEDYFERTYVMMILFGCVLFVFGDVCYRLIGRYKINKGQHCIKQN